MSDARRAFFAGVRAEVPILLGVVPFGLIYGITALAAGIPPLLAQAMSWIVFAGSAQFVIAQLVGGGAPALVIVVTAFVVNLRHVLYSASVAPYVQALAPGWKRLLAYLLTDEAYAVVITQFRQEPEGPGKRWYFLGAGLALWATWQASTAVGIFLGASIPASWPLDFALPLTFLALAVPAIRDRATAAAAVAAGVIVVLAAGLPHRLDLLAAAAVGALVGLAVEAAGARMAPEAARGGNSE